MIAMATATKMRAIVCHRPSSPAELRVEELDRPALPVDGLLVRVHASSANPVDLFQLSRVAHLQRGFKPAVAGTDFAGVVEDIGPDVTSFRSEMRYSASRGAPLPSTSRSLRVRASCANPRPFRSKMRERSAWPAARRCSR
jgi:NADPH2:quinone reductase